LPTPGYGGGNVVRVPILMYHYISVPPADADIYRVDLSVTPDQFRAQMAYLVENGFTALDLYDLSMIIANQQPLPPKPVILTFDDGYVDNYVNAFPVLQEFGLKGTFFIITELVDKQEPNYMSWAMIEEMAAAGHRMESHTKTHPDLREKSWDHHVWQILGSQQTLAAHIGYTPRYFCYPGGVYDQTALDVLQALDFWGAVTTAGGRWHGFDDRYEWTRMRIRNTTTLAGFAEIVVPQQ
jgi:peptidoglycan/xylan/chitin deacetylase (PgdA/CDA1 family)